MDKAQRSTRRDEMFFHIESWQGSGNSQKSYCTENNIPYSVFQYWRRKYLHDRETSDSADFAELVIGGAPRGMEILYPNGVILRLPHGVDPSKRVMNYAELAMLIEGLSIEKTRQQKRYLPR